MKAKINITIAAISLLVLLPLKLAGGDQPLKTIEERLLDYTESAWPQKVYLHIDKSSYRAGETIWFKAYLFDGVTHKPDPRRTNLYTELINSDGKAMGMNVLLSENGYATGEIKLDANLPDGNYLLRSYSAWMRNFGEEHYFTRHFYIENPRYENMIPRMDVFRNRLFNRRIDRMMDNFEVVFFPEGGHLVAGVDNRVAFKVVDELGRGQEARGEILNSRGESVVSFNTKLPGIGAFMIKPLPGESYRARIAVGDGSANRYEFPVPEQNGFALRIDPSDEEVIINISAAQGSGTPAGAENMRIVAHSRGIPHFASPVKLEEGRADIRVEMEVFPGGITHFTLFNGYNVPLAERLAFTGRGKELSITPRLTTSSLNDPDHIDLSFVITGRDGEPVEGIFSMAAVTGKEVNGVQKMDLITYMLLDSDLKGMISDPSVYTSHLDDNPEAADLLLMTYGWRRFNWEDVIDGEPPQMAHSASPGLTIGGRLMDPAKNEALTNYPVQLRITNGQEDLFKTNTSRNGVFAFTDLFYKGVVSMELSSRRLPANYPPSFELNVSEGTGYDYQPGAWTLKQRVTARGENWSRVRGVSSSPYSSAPRRNTSAQIYGVPDQTIFIDYETSTERNLFEILRNRATGLNFEGGRIIIRGPASLTGPTEARFMVDGLFVDREIFLSLYPREVERIEIFRGTSTAIFGIRGGTGVIIAYTRRPSYHGFEDVLELAMLGYHEPADFYSDMIITPWTSYDSDTERTIYWEPNLRSGPDGKLDVRLPLRKGVDSLRFTIEGAGLEGGLGSMQFTLDIDSPLR